MKFFRKTADCDLSDHRRHESTTEEVKMTPTVHTAMWNKLAATYRENGAVQTVETDASLSMQRC
jgi:hypothetical protein